MKAAAGAMMIKLRDLIVTKGQNGGSVDVTRCTENAFSEIIDLHNSAFGNSVNQFTPSDAISRLMVTQPSPTRVSNAPQHRLKRAADPHMARDKRNAEMTIIAVGEVRKNKKSKGRQCGF